MIDTKKISLIIIIFAFFNIAMIKNSNAEYSDFEWFNNAPRMTIQTDKNKYTDVKFTFKDLNGFNIDNIKIYTVDSKGNKTAEITNNDKIITKKETSESDKPNVYTTYVYTMSNEFLNKETHRFYIELTDNTNQYLRSYFRIVDNGKGYGVDYAPRIIYWGTNGKKVYFTARDLAGTKELRLYDMNNDKKYDKKWIVRKTNLAKGNAKVTFNLSSFKKKDGMYRIRVYAIDKKNGQNAYREVYFKLKDTPSNSSSTNTNKNKTVTGISVNKKPTKQTYTQNTDNLDLSGGEIRVIYSDSSSKIVAMTNKNVKNSGFSNSKVGTIQIKLEYSGKVTSFNVNIKQVSGNKQSTNPFKNAKKYNKIKVLKSFDINNLELVVKEKLGGTYILGQALCVTDKYYVTSQCTKTSSNDSTRSCIKIFDKNTKKKIKTYNANFSHANGLAYNKKTNQIYVAHRNGKKYSKFSADDFDKASTLNASTKQLSKPVSAIAYDEYTDSYYTAKGNYIYVYDSQFKLKHTIKKLRSYTAQDIGAYKGLILVVVNNQNASSVKNSVDIYRASDKAYLGSYDFKGDYEMQSLDYYGSGNTFSLCFVRYNRDNSHYIYNTDGMDFESDLLGTASISSW